MTRTTPVVVAAVLVVGTLAAVPVAGLAAETGTPTETPGTEAAAVDQRGNASIAPGAQLAGVVGVQEAELEGDVESRAYGVQVAQAKTNGSKAAVVAERVAAIERRLQELETRRQALQQARENGSLSEGAYRAKVAALHARTETAERLVNETNATAQSLPADVLAEKGIDVTAIRTLRDRANELSGPEVAEIARSIAGEGVGKPARAGAPGDRGPERGDGAGAGAADGDRDADGKQGGQADDARGNGQGSGDAAAGSADGDA